MKINLAICPSFMIMVVIELLIIAFSHPKENYFNTPQLVVFGITWIFIHLAMLLRSITIVKE